MTERVPVLRAEGLSIRRGGTTLLAPSAFEVYEGERILLLGGSGAGKSLFADLLLGFIGAGVDVEGTFTLDGEDLIASDPESHDGKVGAVFQLHALGLFDDLTLDKNLEFGSDEPAKCQQVAEQLRLSDRQRPVTACSGGERVRTALARTLLRGAGVLVFDEPTTGLDAAAAEQVVLAVRESHQRVTVVITHDLPSFANEADAVLFIEPSTRQIVRRPLDKHTLPDIQKALEIPAATLPLRDVERPGFGERALAASNAIADAIGGFVHDMAQLVMLPWCWARLFHPLDGPRLRSALKRNLAPGVLAFTAVSSVLIAMTGTYFLFERLPERLYTEPLVQDDLIAGIGLIFTRVGVPLMVSVLLAAKLGASAAAHLGHMAVTRQVDALRLLRIDPRRHLLLPTATGQLAAALLCTTVCIASAWFASLLVFLVRHEGWSTVYFLRAWNREIAWTDYLWVAAKVSVAALGVAAIAFRAGTAPKREPEAVVAGIHSTLLRGLLFVILVHAVFAFLEF